MWRLFPPPILRKQTPYSGRTCHAGGSLLTFLLVSLAQPLTHLFILICPCSSLLSNTYNIHFYCSCTTCSFDFRQRQRMQQVWIWRLSSCCDPHAVNIESTCTEAALLNIPTAGYLLSTVQSYRLTFRIFFPAYSQSCLSTVLMQASACF